MFLNAALISVYMKLKGLVLLSSPFFLRASLQVVQFTKLLAFVFPPSHAHVLLTPSALFSPVGERLCRTRPLQRPVLVSSGPCFFVKGSDSSYYGDYHRSRRCRQGGQQHSALLISFPFLFLLSARSLLFAHIPDHFLDLVLGFDLSFKAEEQRLAAQSALESLQARLDEVRVNITVG